MKLVTDVAIDQGQRKYQEDAFSITKFPHGNLYIVCDGLGGEGDGDFASNFVVNKLPKAFEENFSELNKKKFFENLCSDVSDSLINEINIQGKSRTASTTMVAAYIKNDGVAHVCSVGDSISMHTRGDMCLYENEKHKDYWGGITSAFGIYYNKCDVKTIKIEVGDYLILASDGLEFIDRTDYIPYILDSVSKSTPEEAAKNLVKDTLVIEHKMQDNICCISIYGSL